MARAGLSAALTLAVGAILPALAGSPLDEPLQSVIREANSASPDWQAVARDVQAARQLDPESPRVDYAIGLALLAKPDREQAARYFARAQRQGDVLYFPAWRAAIRLQLQERNERQALSLWNDLGRALMDSNTVYSGLANRSEGATFLGRVTGFLELPGSEWDDRDRWDTLVASFEDRLTGDLFHAYHAGRHAVSEEHSRLEREYREQRDRRESQQRKAAEAKQDEIEALRDELELRQQELELTRKELKDRFDQELAEATEQLEQVQQDHESTTQAATQMLSLIVRTTEQIDRVVSLARLGLTQRTTQIRSQRLSPDRLSPAQRRNIQWDLMSLEGQREGYQRQLESLNQRAEQLSAQASLLAERRSRINRQYELAARTLLAQERLAARDKQALERSLEKLRRRPGPSAVNASASRLLSPTTYFPIDWQREMERISE